MPYDLRAAKDHSLMIERATRSCSESVKLSGQAVTSRCGKVAGLAVLTLGLSVSMGNAIAQDAATRESYQVLGQRITFVNPEGYCTPKGSPREAELIDVSRSGMGPDHHLVHLAVLCSELDELRTGKRERPAHWLQIQLLGRNGQFKRWEMTREAWLAAVTKSNERIDSAKVTSRANAQLEKIDISVSGAQIVPLGRDANAIYYLTTAIANIDGLSLPVTALSAGTIVKSLKLSINVYEATGTAKSRQQLQTVHKQLLNSLLTEN